MKNLAIIFSALFFSQLTFSQTATDYFKKGNSVLFENPNSQIDFKAVLGNYNNAIKLNPKYILCLGMRGLVKIELEDFTGAVQDFDLAIKLLDISEQSSDYNLRLAGALYLHKALTKIKMPKDVQSIMENLNKSMEISPDLISAPLSTKIGGFQVSEKYYQNAIVFLDTLTEKSPNNENLFFIRAFLKYSVDDFHGALEDYDKSIELNSRYALLFYNRGLVKQQLKMTSEAIKDYTEAIALDPKDGDYYLQRALAKQLIKDNEGALEDYIKDIFLNPGRNLSRRNIGIILSELNDPTTAIVWYNKIISLDANNNSNVEYYLKRGLAKFKTQDFNGAIQDYNMTIKLCDGFSELYEAYLNRGIAKIELKDFRGAILDFNKLIEKSTKIELGYFYRADAKGNLEDYTGAKEDYNKAIKSNSSFAEAYFNRGILKLEKLNDKNGACQDFSKAGELGIKEAYDVISKSCQ